MTNIYRAADILAEAGAYCGQCCFGECGEPDCPRDADWRACPDCAAAVNGYAHALADAGLLAPDPTYRSAPLVGMTWDEEDGVPDGYVHLTFRVPETGRGFSAKDTATINLAGTDHAEGGAS